MKFFIGTNSSITFEQLNIKIENIDYSGLIRDTGYFFIIKENGKLDLINITWIFLNASISVSKNISFIQIEKGILTINNTKIIYNFNDSTNLLINSGDGKMILTNLRIIFNYKNRDFIIINSSRDDVFFENLTIMFTIV